MTAFLLHEYGKSVNKVCEEMATSMHGFESGVIPARAVSIQGQHGMLQTATTIVDGARHCGLQGDAQQLFRITAAEAPGSGGGSYSAKNILVVLSEIRSPSDDRTTELEIIASLKG